MSGSEQVDTHSTRRAMGGTSRWVGTEHGSTWLSTVCLRLDPTMYPPDIFGHLFGLFSHFLLYLSLFIFFSRLE